MSTFRMADAPARIGSRQCPAGAHTYPPRTWALAGLIAVTSLVLVVPLVRLGQWAMTRDYYHHMPLMIVGALVYAGSLLRRFPPTITPLVSLRVLAWTGLALLLTSASYAMSSLWLAAPAALATLAATIRFLGGRPLAELLRGPIIVLVACVPLPVNMDNRFVLSMQQLATTLGSYWLDWAGVLHLATGVDIRTPSHSFVVEDACSGIHSMFAAIAIGVVYGVWRCYRLVRLAALVVLMVAWVVLANALRVFFVVYAQSRWNLDLANGFTHEVVGMLTFVVGILLAISGDHFWRYLHPNARRVSVEDAVAIPYKPRFLDRAVSARVATGVIAVLALAGGSAFAAFASLSHLGTNSRSIEELAQSAVIDFDTVAQSFFPEELAGWSLLTYSVDENTSESVFGGMKSFRWRFSNGSRSVALSLDGPYPDWHDLAVCYSATGWNLRQRDVVDIGSGETVAYSTAELTMRRLPIEHAAVLFACVAPDGAPVDPPADFIGDWGYFLHRVRNRLGGFTDHGGGVIQLQLLAQAPVELTDAQMRENRQLFQAAITHAFGPRR